jgi:hypothetical protein
VATIQKLKTASFVHVMSLSEVHPRLASIASQKPGSLAKQA